MMGVCSRHTSHTHLYRPAGHEVFVVGGTVRDLLLGRSAVKDVDVLTSAPLRSARALFDSAAIYGQRHPIVHVDLGQGVHLDISSMERAGGAAGSGGGGGHGGPATTPLDAARLLQRPPAGRLHHVSAGRVRARAQTHGLLKCVMPPLRTPQQPSELTTWLLLHTPVTAWASQPAPNAAARGAHGPSVRCQTPAAGGARRPSAASLSSPVLGCGPRCKRAQS